MILLLVLLLVLLLLLLVLQLLVLGINLKIRVCRLLMRRFEGWSTSSRRLIRGVVVNMKNLQMRCRVCPRRVSLNSSRI